MSSTMYRLGISALAVGASARSILQKRDPNANVLNGVNWPDPCILDYNGRIYTYATSNGEAQIPVRSTDNFDDPNAWSTSSIEVLPVANIPAWSGANNNWAPDVSQLPDGSFVMYYAPALNGSSKHAIGVGKSDSPEGPFVIADEPFESDPTVGGYIDPDGFLDDDGRRYVIYKQDGNSIASGGCSANGPAPYATTPFYLQEVDANDGVTKVGDRVEIFNNNGAEDDYNIEAPSMTKVDGTYFLFFSKGCFADSSYATLYVTSTNITGPYGNRGTLIQSGDYGESGPGSCDLDNQGRIVYHSLFVAGDISKGRQLNTDTVTYNGQTVTLN